MEKQEGGFLESSTKILFFLFVLSISYYLAFWTHFDINVFQYLAIEDITKGIAYPLRFAGVGILFLSAVIVLLLLLGIFISSVDKDGEMRPFKSTKGGRKVLKILFLTTLFASVVFYSLPEYTFIGIAVSFVMSLFLMALYYIGRDDADSVVTKVIAPSLKYCAIFLTINSIIAGVYESNRISKQVEYNYVVQQDIAGKIKTDAPYLIFLGAVSDKYIFIDKSGFEHYIVEKSELPSLKFHHYYRGDSSSVIHMNTMLEQGRILKNP